MLRRTLFRSFAVHLSLTDLVDRVALTAGQLAMLAALPVAAVVLIAQSI